MNISRHKINSTEWNLVFLIVGMYNNASYKVEKKMYVYMTDTLKWLNRAEHHILKQDT